MITQKKLDQIANLYWKTRKNKYKDLFNKRKITAILNFMKSDKKNQSDSVNLILIRNFGKLNLNYQAKSSELNKFLLKELNKAYL